MLAQLGRKENRMLGLLFLDVHKPEQQGHRQQNDGGLIAEVMDSLRRI
jgi:hypothetical protein